jgi:hypothetical protein
MHSYEDRIRAVELYYRYGKSQLVELGYLPQNSWAVGSDL